MKIKFLYLYFNVIEQKVPNVIRKKRLSDTE